MPRAYKFTKNLNVSFKNQNRSNKNNTDHTYCVPTGCQYKMPPTILANKDYFQDNDNNEDEHEVTEEIVPVEENAIFLEEAFEENSEEHLLSCENNQATETLLTKLKLWATSCNIKHVHLNWLLKLLVEEGGLHGSTDARTLLCTPKLSEAKYIQPLDNGQYLHFGVESSLKSILDCLNVSEITLYLSFNVDGTPTSMSGGHNFWLILGCVNNLKNKVFVVGIFESCGKPDDYNNFLKQFVNELENLMENGLTHKFKSYIIKIHSFVCDAPAMAAIKQVKSHGGYFSCQKCFTKGSRLITKTGNKVVYPELNAPLRSDENFRKRINFVGEIDEGHHKISRSILERLPIDMVDHFSLDKMHLVDEGVCKKLIQIWIGKPSKQKLQSSQLLKINEHLKVCSKYSCSEFQRNVRTLKFSSFFKAHEFRIFLLYTGPAVLKGVISSSAYKHFLCLSLAIRILTSPVYYRIYNEYAEDLLKYFVKHFPRVYGLCNTTYNVHGLIHLAKDAYKLGPLDENSCYKFEAYIKIIKSFLRSSYRPLEQCFNRISEINSIRNQDVPVLSIKEPSLNKRIAGSNIFKICKFSDYIIRANTLNDNCLMLRQNHMIIRVKYFEKDVESVYIYGQKFSNTKSIHSEPQDLNNFFMLLGQFEEDVAQQVGLLTDAYQYIIANLDFHTIDLEPFQYADTNITSFRIISPEDPRVVEVLKFLYGPDEDLFRNASCPMTVNMGLVYDGVVLLAETYKHISYAPTQLNCNDDNTWDKGFTLVNYLKSITLNGLSGEIKFDHQGLRTDFQLEIIELATSGITKVGSWKPRDGVLVQRNVVPFAFDGDNRSLANKSFIVITALTDPYGMLKESPIKLSGNDQYEGFGIELIQELGKKLGFNYTFLLQEDNVYGSINPETGEWNGMLKEVLEHRADMAITDLTMTSDRESAVDFTIPFMNLGIAILYKKPTKEPPKLFSFMSPFSGQVWLYLGVAYFSVSLSLFILGRLSPTEWDNPYPCIEEPTELENQFSFANSLWFTMGALLQQGSEIAPKSPSTRTVASIWWFFTLIMVSSYTANLAAFLTVESLSSPIESAEDLANGKGGVKYGAKRGGSTFNFFKEAKYPPYVKMYEFMKEHPEYCPSSNAEGVNKVEKENYAFLMESTSIEYIIERKCSLTQVGSLLDEKGYGIAMRKNWPYRDSLSQAVLELQEQGILTKMKTKWWKEKRGGGTCSDTSGDGGAVALELANLGGVFVVLIIGSFFAVFFTILEMIIDVKRRSTESKQDKDKDKAEELGMANLGGVYFVLLVGSSFASFYGFLEWLLNIFKTVRHSKSSFKAELVDELKFIMKCSGNTKVVKHSKRELSISSTSTVSIDSIESNNPDEVKLRNGADQLTLTY